MERHSGSMIAGFKAKRLGMLMFIPLSLGCRQKPVYVEPPPRWRWANVGECSPDAPARELTRAARDSLGNPFGRPGTQDVLADRAAISRIVPGGWGGLTRPAQGEGAAIFLVDTTKRDTALAVLLNAGVRYIARTSQAKQGRWTYTQLYDWFRYIQSHLRRVAVTMWALDEWRNSIRYGVETEEAGLELDRQLTAL